VDHAAVEAELIANFVEFQRLPDFELLRLALVPAIEIGTAATKLEYQSERGLTLVGPQTLLG
jgi:hypothetical protein